MTEPQVGPFQRKVWVLASVELLEEMRKGWSHYVQVHAEPLADSDYWELTFRTSDAPDADPLKKENA